MIQCIFYSWTWINIFSFVWISYSLILIKKWNLLREGSVSLNVYFNFSATCNFFAYLDLLTFSEGVGKHVVTHDNSSNLLRLVRGWEAIDISSFKLLNPRLLLRSRRASSDAEHNSHWLLMLKMWSGNWSTFSYLTWLLNNIFASVSHNFFKFKLSSLICLLKMEEAVTCNSLSGSDTFH